jgi:hypothetical protein
MWRLVLLGGWAAIFGGCTATPAPVPAGTRYDGRYVGQDTLVAGVAFLCGAPALPLDISVRDGRFDYPFQVSPPRAAALPVIIAADGTMAGQMQYGTGEEIPEFSRDRIDWVYLRGRVSEAMMDATVSTERCVRRLTGRWSSN